MPPKPAPQPQAPANPKCPECGTVAVEPRLRYCENCGARMPEYKSPTMMMMAAGGEAVEGSAKAAEVKAAPKKPPYTGPKWLEHVPGHSPSVVGVGLHWVALALSIIPALAGVGPFWSAVMAVGSVLVVTRVLYVAGERPPLFDLMPKPLKSRKVTAVYIGLAAGLSLPMLELSIQPLLWLGGTVLLVRDQWAKVFAMPKGYMRLFDPHSLWRSYRIMALVGVALCVVALLFPWSDVNLGQVLPATPPAEGAQGLAQRLNPFDSVYNDPDTADLRASGIDLPVAPTVALGLLTLLVLSMLRPEVDRPEWLRFVPAGITVIALAWGLVNMKMRVGPIMFAAGMIPVGLVALMMALGRDELTPSYADDFPPEEDPPTEEAGPQDKRRRG